MPALTARNPHRNAPEYADRVNLIKKIKIGKDWRFAPVVPEANGRLKDKVRVNGQVEVHSEGSYYIEWWVSGRRFREATPREDAIECARHKSVELRAVRAGLIASPEPKPEAEAKTPIGDAIDGYLKYVKMQRKSRTFLTYRYTLDVLLRASYKKKYVEDATRQDAIDFMTYCYEQGLGARTVYDKVVTVLQLFKKHGRAGLMEKGDWPKYVDAIRPMYEPEELNAMFGVATEDEQDLLKFILGSGFRDQEHRTIEYVDLDFRHDLARVTAKPKWDFTPKNWEERVVPLPHGLMERMKRRMERKKARPHDLVFGNTKGRPDSELDMVVKRVAQRAGLNCGHCVTEHGNKCADTRVSRGSLRDISGYLSDLSIWQYKAAHDANMSDTKLAAEVMKFKRLISDVGRSVCIPGEGERAGFFDQQELFLTTVDEQLETETHEQNEGLRRHILRRPNAATSK